MNCKQVWGSRSQFFAQPPDLLQPGKTALDSPAFGHRVEDVGLLILTIRAATVLAKNVFDVLREGPTHAAAIAQQALRPAQEPRLQRPGKRVKGRKRHIVSNWALSLFGWSTQVIWKAFTPHELAPVFDGSWRKGQPRKQAHPPAPSASIPACGADGPP